MIPTFHFYIIPFFLLILFFLVRQEKLVLKLLGKVGLIEAALDTDIRNNIEVEREFAKFIREDIRLDVSNKAEWALIRYLEDKMFNTIKGYKEIKNDIGLLSSSKFKAQFLGNGRAELEQLYIHFPEEFLRKINAINEVCLSDFVKNLILTDIPFEVKRGKYFNLKIAVIKSFKEDVHLILEVWNRYKYLVPKAVLRVDEQVGALVFTNNISLNKRALIENLHDFNATINSLETWNQFIPKAHEHEYILLLADLRGHQNTIYTMTAEEQSVLSERLKVRVLSLIDRLDNEYKSKQ